MLFFFVSCYWYILCEFIMSFFFFFFKQKTAYEMRISDWSSDVCSSDLLCAERRAARRCRPVDAAAGGYDGLKEPASRTLLRARDGSRSRRVAKDLKQDTK